MRKRTACLLSVCQLLFHFIPIVLCGLQGDVITEEKTNVNLGKRVTLKCVLQKASDVLQVTWQKKTGAGLDNVATYSTKQGVKVNNGYRDRLNITLLKLNETAITFYRVTLEDEACYQCLFNTFPSGSSQGSTCLSITGDVATEDRTVAEVGTIVTLKCVLRKHLDILQITWQKNTTEAMVNLATYATKTGVSVNKTYKDRLNITLLALNETSITLWKVNFQDEGCYQCLFNSFPSGSVSGTTCLSIYGQLQVFLQYFTSSEGLNATCFATSWPAPVLQWPGMGEVLQNGNSSIKNSNGTVSVRSWILLNDSQSLQGTQITCRAQHHWSEDLRTITVNEGQSVHIAAIVVFAAVTLSLTAIL